MNSPPNPTSQTSLETNIQIQVRVRQVVSRYKRGLFLPLIGIGLYYLFRKTPFKIIPSLLFVKRHFKTLNVWMLPAVLRRPTFKTNLLRLSGAQRRMIPSALSRIPFIFDLLLQCVMFICSLKNYFM